MGLAVNQRGRLTATTSVLRNGSIRLLARDKVSFATQAPTVDGTPLTSSQTAIPRRAGTVRLAAGSSTSVLLDDTSNSAVPYDIDTTSVLGSRLRSNGQRASEVRITGKSVVMERDSALRAPAGMKLTAWGVRPQG